MNKGYFMVGLTLLVFGSILVHMVVTYIKARHTRSKKDDSKMTEEELVNKNYDAEQCSHRRWNEEEQKWERAFGVCAICSYMCPQKAEDFAKMGKKEYVDKHTGLHYWK